MFTGIIEDLGVITNLRDEQNNLHLTVKSRITSELKIDQSVSHNGICLTVVDIIDDSYIVTAIKETINKTNIGDLNLGDIVNLERAMKLGDRLDGHIVQGHVDQVGICEAIKEENGSVSLTVVNSEKNRFSVAIIPYTYEHTNFKNFTKGSRVNLEFDVLGKYIQKLYEARL